MASVLIFGRGCRPVLAWAAAGIASVSPVAARAESPAVTASYSVSGTLYAVAAMSASSAWAVGGINTRVGTGPLIARWNGRAWLRQASPGSAADGFLDGVAASSARSAWAVGVSDGRTLITRWNGKTWKRVPSPSPGGDDNLSAVAVISSGDAWAVGVTGAASSLRTLILHWNGKTWKRVPSPSPTPYDTLAGVVATSARNAWAVGFAYAKAGGTGNSRTLILHWNGQAWKRVPSPSPGRSAGLTRVAATSARNAWAVGDASSGKTLILHWDGRSWKQVTSPSPEAFCLLSGVAVTSAGNAWAVGTEAASQSAEPDSLILHWNGRAWKRAPGSITGRSDVLNSVAATSAGNAWAVGSNGASGKTLILHWNGTSWK